MLYGLGDDGVPTDAIIAGARPTNVTQKAPTAPSTNGDPLAVERSFFENGGEYLMVNIQDYYPDWAYNGGKRPEDFDTYLDIVRTVVTSIVEESDYPERYVFTPFNEPDGGNWYGDWGTMRDTFLADWKVTYDTIKEIYPRRRSPGQATRGGTAPAPARSSRSRRPTTSCPTSGPGTSWASRTWGRSGPTSPSSVRSSARWVSDRSR
ncbi:hypothetical protein NKG05_04985 [Oerskovia sp. M15]